MPRRCGASTVVVIVCICAATEHRQGGEHFAKKDSLVSLPRLLRRDTLENVAENGSSESSRQHKPQRRSLDSTLAIHQYSRHPGVSLHGGRSSPRSPPMLHICPPRAFRAPRSLWRRRACSEAGKSHHVGRARSAAPCALARCTDSRAPSLPARVSSARGCARAPSASSPRAGDREKRSPLSCAASESDVGAEGVAPGAPIAANARVRCWTGCCGDLSRERRRTSAAARRPCCAWSCAAATRPGRRARAVRLVVAAGTPRVLGVDARARARRGCRKRRSTVVVAAGAGGATGFVDARPAGLDARACSCLAWGRGVPGEGGGPASAAEEEEAGR